MKYTSSSSIVGLWSIIAIINTIPAPVTPAPTAPAPTADGPCGGGTIGNGVCVIDGECCSSVGYCGTSPDHCGDGEPKGEDPDRVYKDSFQQLFQIQTVKTTGLGVDDPWQPNGGNAIKMSKDGKAVLVTHRDGSLSFLDPNSSGAIGNADSASLYPALDAAQLINDKHGTSLEFIECRSGIALSPDGANENIIVYAVIEGVASIGQQPLHTAVVDPSVSQSYLIIIKVPDDFGVSGSTLEITVSDPIPGDAVGTPVLGRNAEYAYITSNRKNDGSATGGNGTTASATSSTNQYDEGYLSVVDTSSGSIEYEFPVNVPVGEAGIYHEPTEQFFDGAESDNTNDLVVFSERPACRECSVDTPEQGEMFAFAFKGPSSNPVDPEQLKTLGIKPFKGYMAPVIFNDGYSMIMPTTAHSIRGWFNQEFSENPEGKTVGGQPLRRAQRFEYPDPSGVVVLNDPPPTSPLYIEDGDDAFVYSNFGRHDVALAKLNAADLSVLWFIPTTTGSADFRSFAISRPVLTPDNEYVLWSESGTGKNGQLHMVSASDGSHAVQSVTIPDVTTADIAISNDGTMVYVIGDYGLLRAYKFADLLRTDSPTRNPTRAPVQPTLTPTEFQPTAAPVEETTAPTGITVTTDEPTTAMPSVSDKQPTEDVDPPPSFGECEGDCMDDSDCEGDLVCLELIGDDIPGSCATTSTFRDSNFEAICVPPLDDNTSKPPTESSKPPSPVPSEPSDPTDAPTAPSGASSSIVTCTTTVLVTVLVAVFM